MQLTGAQRKYLRGLAHNLNPAAFVGQKGLNQALVDEIDNALEKAELIKIKFIEHKDKPSKTAILNEIVRQTGASLAGMTGHVAIIYRQNKDPEKRKIKLA